MRYGSQSDLDLTVDRETVECDACAAEQGTFLAVYVARVRVTVHADGVVIVREGHGTAEGQARPG
jgi:hypothetical protein